MSSKLRRVFLCRASALLALSCSFSIAAANVEIAKPPQEQTVILIKSPPEILTRQKLPNFPGALRSLRPDGSMTL
jgi:hypothetical protein